jgi:hypothetical protein
MLRHVITSRRFEQYTYDSIRTKLIHTPTLAAKGYEICCAKSPVEIHRMIERLSDWSAFQLPLPGCAPDAAAATTYFGDRASACVLMSRLCLSTTRQSSRSIVLNAS